MHSAFAPFAKYADEATALTKSANTHPESSSSQNAQTSRLQKR